MGDALDDYFFGHDEDWPEEDEMIETYSIPHCSYGCKGYDGPRRADYIRRRDRRAACLTCFMAGIVDDIPGDRWDQIPGPPGTTRRKERRTIEDRRGSVCHYGRRATDYNETEISAELDELERSVRLQFDAFMVSMRRAVGRKTC